MIRYYQREDPSLAQRSAKSLVPAPNLGIDLKKEGAKVLTNCTNLESHGDNLAELKNLQLLKNA